MEAWEEHTLFNLILNECSQGFHYYAFAVKLDRFVESCNTLMFRIQLHVAVKNGKYLASIMDDLASSCDEVVESGHEEIKAIPSNFNEKKPT